MPASDARKFVERMREDHKFRHNVLKTRGSADLSSFLETEGLVFDRRELIRAMAECMAQLELQMTGN